MSKTESSRKVESQHSKALFRTYLILAIAFLSMIAINIVAYMTISSMSEMQSRLGGALSRFKLKVISADLLARDILRKATTRDMDDVWKLLDKAKEEADRVGQVDGENVLHDRLEEYKSFLLKVYTPPTEKEQQELDVMTPAQLEKYRRELKEEYLEIYDKLLKASDLVDLEVTKLVRRKTRMFDVLYGALLVNILVLCIIIVINMAVYVRNRKAVEQQITETRDMLDTILNSLGSMVISVDQIGTIIEWNAGAEEYFGYTDDDVLENNITEVLPFMTAYHTLIERVFHSKKPETRYREQVKMDDGRSRCFDIVFNYSPGIQGVVIRMEDVSAQEMKEEQVRQAQKMEVVERMVTGLANDFNNVLGAITNTIPLLRFAVENPDMDRREMKNNIDVIESSTERAVVMVQQLLSMSQKHEIKKETLDLNDTIKHVMNICANTIDKRIELRMGLYAGARALVSADPVELEQALLNLCDNASQAMTSMRSEEEIEGGALSMSVDRLFPNKEFREDHPQATKDSYWVVTVEDTGVGMPSDVAARVFDPFYSTKEGQGGTGLGLTRVNDIIKLHEGFIEVNSEIGSGTSFHIYVPEYIAAPGIDEDSIRVSKQESIPTGEGLIMVVDDEPVMRKTAGSILQKLGYEVCFAEDGQEAVEIFQERSEEIQCTLLDLMMPRMSGKDAYVEMKKIDPNLKALMISGFKKDERIQEALNLGVNGFIQKPYSLLALATEVHNLVGGGGGASIQAPVASTPSIEPAPGGHSVSDVGAGTAIIDKRDVPPPSANNDVGSGTVILPPRKPKSE